MQCESLAGVFLSGNAPFINVPVTGALRRVQLDRENLKEMEKTSPE